MAEKLCSSMNRSIDKSSSMDQNDHEKKDISRIFSRIRTKLNEKEKELLELQRAESSLFAPDSDQIDNLLDVISSIHLSTADGSFLVPSTQDKSSSTTTLCPSTGIQTIKTLPSNVWLNEKPTENDEDTSALRLPLVSQLFSMSPSAFIASKSKSNVSTTVDSIQINQVNDQPNNRLPMITELLSMPIDAFKPSKNTQSPDITTNVRIIPPPPPTATTTITTEIQVKPVSPPMTTTTTTVKSILDGDSVYSKDFWLKKPEKLTEKSDQFDIEKYIEQTSEKMRRLHLDYVAALNQLQNPTNDFDSTSTMKSIYPQVFDRIQPTLPSRGRAQPSTTTK